MQLDRRGGRLIVPLRIVAQYYLAAASHLAGDYGAMDAICRKLMQSLHDQPTRERFGLTVFPTVMSRAYLARALAERGVFDEGEAHGQEASRIAEALDHPFSVVVGYVDLAYLKSIRGGRYLVHRNFREQLDVAVFTLAPQNYAFALTHDNPRREAINRSLLVRTSESAWEALLFRYLGQ